MRRDERMPYSKDVPGFEVQLVFYSLLFSFAGYIPFTAPAYFTMGSVRVTEKISTYVAVLVVSDILVIVLLPNTKSLYNTVVMILVCWVRHVKSLAQIVYVHFRKWKPAFD